jgi:1-deoxy-D-xylulose-5-phosphate reductoisomerase
VIGVSVLGSTGSIGTSTLDVVGRHPERFRVVALTANRDVETLAAQCGHFRPDYAVLADASAAARLAERLRAAGSPTRVLAGAEGLETVARLPEVGYVMAAIVGAAGLVPALAAAQAGKRVLLANKEALVVAGALFMEAARGAGAEILPIDSEHNAVFQCLPASFARGLGSVGVRRILLTASGGPFRSTPVADLERVTPEQACAHPNWSMGRKISVDSATMMNKGLEVIEAHWLFGAAPEQIDVVLHPQSVVHSMVEFVDGSVLAQLGNPDMRTPIAHALGWPERMESGVGSLNLVSVGRLDFEPPDLQRFPCLGLAYDALRAGGTAPAILNAANEVAVQAFLDGRIRFTGIPRLVGAVLENLPSSPVSDLGGLLAIDAETRGVAERMITAESGRR